MTAKTRGDRVIAFVHRYLKVPEGKLIGRPIRLLPFQAEFIRAIYDNPVGTKRAYLSIGRKNGKSAVIACIALAHIVGPEAVTNSQIVSGARSRERAALVFKLMAKMIRMSPELSKLAHITDSAKSIRGLARNVEYKAVSAEAGTAHGLSPVLAILDEVGQIKGPYDAFVEAIETAQGAYDNPLLIAISTQAATDGDLFSTWLDDAKSSAELGGGAVGVLVAALILAIGLLWRRVTALQDKLFEVYQDSAREARETQSAAHTTLAANATALTAATGAMTAAVNELRARAG